MNNFNLLRIKSVLVWDFYSNWKKYLRFFIGIVIVLFAAEILTMFTYISTELPLHVETGEIAVETAQRSTMNTAFGLSLVILIAYWNIGASMLTGTLKSKQDRTNYLAIPATNIEKFTARWLLCVPILMVVLLAGIFVADLLRMLITPLIGSNSLPLLFTYFIKTLGRITNVMDANSFRILSTLICLQLANHAIFILGSCIFRRHPFLSTCGAMLLLTIFMSIVVNFIVGLDISIEFPFALSEITLSIIIWTVTILFIGLLYWLSFRIFSRIQVIQNKWINF